MAMWFSNVSPWRGFAWGAQLAYFLDVAWARPVLGHSKKDHLTQGGRLAQGDVRVLGTGVLFGLKNRGRFLVYLVVQSTAIYFQGHLSARVRIHFPGPQNLRISISLLLGHLRFGSEAERSPHACQVCFMMLHVEGRCGRGIFL